MSTKEIVKNVNIKNKKASFEYEFLEKYEAGIVLRGTEIKAIRMSKASITEAYCLFDKEELWIKNMNISSYDKGSFYNHDPLSARKLLLKKAELKKLFAYSKEKGLTIIALRLFTNERGYAKIEIALAKGKKLYDKRESIKSRDNEREMQRIKY
ncbi:MAG: SsrA-binding protein SmpB [Cytophaga sp.]|uniref:SsrA-binding protein SmpB n=1 Tax=Cytophaga sp. TaxID=29535 RepID=UPI003F80073E